MKKLILLLVIYSSSPAFAQHWRQEMQMGYVYSVPAGDMRQNIKDAHGMAMSYGLTNPNGRLTYGFEVSFGTYGHEKSEKEFDQGNGEMALMELNVTNNFTNIMAFTRMNFNSHGNFRPYALFKAGYAHYSTDLTISEAGEDHCKSQNSDVVYQDGTFIAGIGGGMQIDMSTIFPKKQKDRFYLNIESSMTSGARVNYMNSDAPAASQQHQSQRTPSDVMVEPVNTQAQVVHEHHTGNLYTSTINMIDFRVGFTFKFCDKHRLD